MSCSFLYSLPQGLTQKLGTLFSCLAQFLVLLANLVFVFLIYAHCLAALAFFYFTKLYKKPSLL